MTPQLELDHLIFVTPDVDATVADLEARLGVTFEAGGRLPAWGTRNRILPLGDRSYLEVMGPDESANAPEGGRILDLDRRTEPSMAWWAVRPFLMELTCGDFQAAGFQHGDVIQGRRELPDGDTLVWEMTDPHLRVEDGMVPLVIDWDGAAHPGDGPAAATLRELRLEHPDHARLSGPFVDIGLPEVHPAEAPAIVATLEGPGGTLTLR